MNLHTYLAFAITVAVAAAIPGPTVMFLVSRSMTLGARSVLPLIAGVTAGDLVVMSLSFLGLGALLQVSVLWFSILKYLGSAYLVYLGIRTFIALPGAGQADPGRDRFISAFLATVLNPKSIVFFMVFVPPFIDVHRPLLPQMALLGPTYLVIGTANATLYAILAKKMAALLNSTRSMGIIRSVGGALLVGAGILMGTISAHV